MFFIFDAYIFLNEFWMWNNIAARIFNLVKKIEVNQLSIACVGLLNDADRLIIDAFVCCTDTNGGAFAPAPYTCKIVKMFDQSSFECIFEAFVRSKSCMPYETWRLSLRIIDFFLIINKIRNEESTSIAISSRLSKRALILRRPTTVRSRKNEYSLAFMIIL